MKEYDHKKIEKKWQNIWDKTKVFQAKSPSSKAKLATGRLEQKKYYALIEFPYPSGDGLHVGHPRPYIGMDIISRKRRLQGFNVLYPIGWDAFGLPTENYAIKTGLDPRVVTKKNTDTFRRQIKSLGISFDWSREINTTDPKYYKWTQWIFLQFLKKGLAYKANMMINWCPQDKTGLANEEVIDGCCERCGTVVEQREKEQWMLAITKYADRLDKDLDTVDYLPQIKLGQRNWIGRSEGVNLRFKVKEMNMFFEMYDSIPQTHMAQTFTVIAPEHPKLLELVKGTEFEESVMRKAKEMIAKRAKGIYKKTEEMDGIFSGRFIEYSPAKRELPIWVASFVVADYGMGIVNCSFHDERDYAFAKKFNIPLHPVLFPKDPILAEKVKKQEIFYREPDGILEEPSQFKGRQWGEVRKDIIDYLVKNGWAKRAVNYKLRDWIFSRQRYWGEPIPMVFCEKCKMDNPQSQGWVPVPLSELPVRLPDIEKYEPTDTGESPLATILDWVNVTCPKCAGPAKRETDTMPNWAGSSWYYLRYIDPNNNKDLADINKLKYWMNVDWYNGGMEHTTLHLLYSRFWHKFLYDIGAVPTIEPYNKRTSHGFILGEGGVKMSKSKGNVINPDEIVNLYGADTLRVYEMFMGPFDQSATWSTENIIGSRRFLDKVWRLHKKVINNIVDEDEVKIILNQTIKKISDDVESMGFNTSISSLMILVNDLDKADNISRKSFEILLRLLAPFAPHITEELWCELGNKESIHLTQWPQFDKDRLIKDSVSVAVQINGKTKSVIEVTENAEQDVVEAEAMKIEILKNNFNNGVIPKKIIYVKNKIINFVS